MSGFFRSHKQYALGGFFGRKKPIIVEEILRDHVPQPIQHNASLWEKQPNKTKIDNTYLDHLLSQY